MPELSSLQAFVETARLTCPVGRVRAVRAGLIMVQGLPDHVGIGAHVCVRRRTGDPLEAEILRLEQGLASVLPGGSPDGVAVGDPVILTPAQGFAPGDHWIGRVVDPHGQPLDGRPLMAGSVARELTPAAPRSCDRRGLGGRMATGLAILNTMLPIVQGQRVGLFAGSGIGKSRLLGQLATGMDADVVVIALIGERGREVNDFVHKVLGPQGMSRTVVLAATSDQSALTRRRCAWSAMATAEYFRDQGLNVLLLADSITRFAEAHREIAVASGEAPALRGHPPSVTPLITALCERAGPGHSTSGDITAVFSVLVPGSDMDEPIADILRGVLDGHIILSRDIAQRGRFPAIDVTRSVSRSLPDAATPQENATIAEVRRLMAAYERSEAMLRAGLYVEGNDATLDNAVRLWPELDTFFATANAQDVNSSFDRLNLILRRSQGPKSGPALAHKTP